MDDRRMEEGWLKLVANYIPHNVIASNERRPPNDVNKVKKKRENSNRKCQKHRKVFL